MHKINTAFIVLAGVWFVGCASSPSAQSGKNAKEPEWVSHPHSVYAEKQYVSAVGFGSDRDSAEKNALGALVAVFGQSVKGETTVSSRYSQAVQSGQIAITENSGIDQAIRTSVDLDTVVGAEIKDTWFDGKKTTYAVAVMDKAKATMLYSNLLEQNEETIARLKDIPEADRDTLDAYARYDLAAEIGDTNGRFLNVLSVVNPAAAAAKRASVSSGATLRVECLRISQTIPIAVTVDNDRDGRVASAFSSVLSDQGFKAGGSDARYVIDTTLTLSPVELKDNPNKFVRYVVDSRLTDRKTGSVLLPYSVTGREGHTTVSEAENRAVRAAEKKVKEDYTVAFKDYLAQLTSKSR
jgi:hypothetical protein